MKTSNVRKLPVASIKAKAQLEYDKDIWDLRNLGIEGNQSRSDYKMNFTRILQPWLRYAAKKYIKYSLALYSVGTAYNKLHALKQFSSFLNDCTPSILASDINRSVIVEYLSYLSSNGLSVNARRTSVCYLSIFLDLCHQEKWADIKTGGLIYRGDIPRLQKCQPRYIPQEIVDQLNQYLDCLPPYIMRTVLILQATGRRVSEICTLPFNPLLQDAHGDWFLMHFQSKMKKEDTIPISREIVAIIQEQQQCVRDHYGNGCQYLFPQPPEYWQRSSKKRKGKPIYQRQVNRCLQKLAIEKDIKDLSGQLWNFQSHQFRHTVGTSMINNGVPIHIVKRYLGHETFEMTLRYAHIHNQTLKEEFAKFQGKVVDVSGKVVEPVNSELELTDLQWFKKNLQAQALPNGSCALPTIMQECPHANACLTCTHFRTTIEFLDQHKQQLAQTEKIIEKAKANNWTRQVEMNERVVNNLQNIINALETGNGN